MLVNWSLDGEKVFVSHSSSVFRVWDVENWSCERWTHLSGMCKVIKRADIRIIKVLCDLSLFYYCLTI